MSSTPCAGEIKVSEKLAGTKVHIVDREDPKNNLDN